MVNSKWWVAFTGCLQKDTSEGKKTRGAMSRTNIKGLRVRSKQMDFATFNNDIHSCLRNVAYEIIFSRHNISRIGYLLETSSLTSSSHITEDSDNLFSQQILLNFQITKECQSFVDNFSSQVYLSLPNREYFVPVYVCFIHFIW